MSQDVLAGPDEFSARAAPLRRELLAHCYRMLGSLDEAEDVVQETYLRAWRAHRGFEGRSSLRVWLYRIATNACLSALRRRGRRALPSGLVGPSADPDGEPVAAPDGHWLQPLPDALVDPRSGDPADVLVARQGVRLALVAGLQLLPARQRAVLLLREVLDVPAAEVAAMLGTSVPAVKSLLQRARARLAALPDAAGAQEPTDPDARAQLELYAAAFEHADLAAMERALRADAAIELVGTRTWFAGRATCLRYLARVLGAPGDWRMRPTRANGSPAALAYRRDGDGGHLACALGVLTATATGIARVTVFPAGPALAARFALPPDLPPGTGR